MIGLLIALVYLSFISLGLGQGGALLGSAWPVIQTELGVPLSFAGILSMIITGCTIISSLLSDRLIKKFSTGFITAVSALLTALALFGFSISNSFWLLCIWAVPYGFSSGTLDVALNNYVALHFASRHMNWLHGFWGIGAATGPYIMSYYLISGLDWSGGYRTVSFVQIFVAVLLFMCLPLWKKPQTITSKEQSSTPVLDLSQVTRIRGVKFILIAFLGYCALESTAGLWASSYLVLKRGISPEIAARYASLFFIGITAGRFLSGFISDKIGDRNMIRIGIAVIFAGIAAVWLPIKSDWLCLNGLIIIGLGCAPVFPSIIHATPENFGKQNSQAIVGVQMASAYTGSTLMPPLFGLIANNINIGLYPVFLLFFAALLLLMTEKLNKKVGKDKVTIEWSSSNY